MHSLPAIDFNNLLKSIVIMLLAILLIGLLLKKLNQPYFVAYIIAGILLGPSVMGIFPEGQAISAIGQLGLVIQMFFIGTKMEIHSLSQNIRKPVIGVIAQLVLSIAFIAILGSFQKWTLKEILLFSFIISLSSSAIILEYLEKNNEIKTPLGSITSGILVLQDFLLVPMLLSINFMAEKNLSTKQVISFVLSAVAVLLFLRYILVHNQFNFCLPEKFKDDHEVQVFAGLLICFGFGWLTESLHLSACIGSLMGGLLIARSTSMKWLESHLVPFRVFFLSMFFLSIGLQVDVHFLRDHAALILLIVAIILLVNSAINAVVFRLLKMSWRDSIYAGALLSQIGEFSLVLCMAGKAINLVNDFWYQLTLTVISATMLATAIWINIIRTFIYKQTSHVRTISRFVYRNLLKKTG